MKIFKSALIVLWVFAFVAIVAKSAGADAWNRKTTFTFVQPVEIPGGVLAPGTYTFQIEDSYAMRNIVRVYNQDGRHLVATLITTNAESMTASEAAVLEFHLGPASAPRALRSWFYPGEKIGREFLYPTAQAAHLEALGAVNVATEGRS